MRWALLFVGGTLLGGAIAFALIGGLSLLKGDEQKPLELVDDAPTDAPIDPSVVEGCPTKTMLTPPWVPQVGAEVAALSLPAPSARLKNRISFWERFWGGEREHVYMLFDSRRPSLIHAVVDCRDLWAKYEDDEQADGLCDKRLIAKKRAVQASLRKARKRPSAKLKKIFGNDKRLIASAWANIFVLEGKRDEIEKAKERAAPYMLKIEKVFETVGVPKELSRLAFTESLFQPDIKSKAGAVGAYQFMRATGRQWLMIERGVDERLDPVRAAYASASYLKQMNKRFDSWPLTLTGYNTGPTRMARLVKRHKTRDIGRLADMRTERNFGFDGQNYYASFYAIVNLTRDLEMDVGDLEREYVAYDDDIALDEVARCHRTSKSMLLQQNPALGEQIEKGELKVPKGYAIALPIAAVATVATEAASPQPGSGS